MKTILILLILFFTQIAGAADIAQYLIEKGSLHKGGVASVEITNDTEEKFTAKMNYEIYKKILVPIPESKLKGQAIFDLPTEFRDETGYLELEAKGTIEIQEVTLEFIRRTTWNNLENAYEFFIIPKDGESKIKVIYHPSIAAAGWANVEVTFISTSPILNGYKLKMNVK